jgi:hypothetical protein
MPQAPPPPRPGRPVHISLPHLSALRAHAAAGGSATTKNGAAATEPSGGVSLVAGAGVLLGLAALLLLARCAHRELRKVARASRLFDVTLGAGEVPWFETRIYVEDDELTCDFTMRVELAELSSRVRPARISPRPHGRARPV